MTRDVRELILSRLAEVVAVTGISSAARNAQGFSDGAALPAVIVSDGGESAAEIPPGRQASIYRVTMEPVVQITAEADEARIGTTLNDLRLRIISAVMNDVTLIELSADNQGLRYIGTMTKFSQGRAVQGDMVIRFSILYYLRPSDF
jgi:hypothetical protein